MSVMKWSRLFVGEPTKVSAARTFAYECVEGRGNTNTIKLVVSELVTNAILHSDSGKPDGWFVLDVLVYPTKVQIRVHDLGGPKEPTRVEATETAKRGRGLMLVDALSIAWGVEGDAATRTVWADIGINPRSQSLR
jgi:anti-sigma regulatory factor (Ser/Thr protein kinase)